MSYVLSCATEDGGQVLVKTAVAKKVEIRNADGEKTVVCMNYIKVRRALHTLV